MNILITGGTGFIGQKLCPFLLKKDYYLKLITRNPGKYSNEQTKNYQFISWNDELTEAMNWADAVINLAGENIFGQRWSDEVKEKIYSSRINSTEKLVEAAGNAVNPPDVMISGSAVGYYGNRGINILTEDEPPGSDFLAKVCTEWEKAVRPIENHGVRLVISRTGIVLGKDGGMLKQMVPPFKFFVGGPVGNGNQFVPWIHRDDLSRLFYFFLTNKETEGAYNVCAPDPVTMDEFARSLGDVLNRPSIFRVPEWILKMAMGEAAEPALQSIRARPERLEQAYFSFNYHYLREALADIL